MKGTMRVAALATLLAFGIAGLSAQTLTVEVFDRATPGYQADNNFLTKWIQDRVKKELGIDVKFVTVPRGQEIDKLNVLMAAGQAPDISFTYNEGLVANYIRSGGLTDLGPLLNQHGPALKKYLGQDLLDFGMWGGKQWAIPAKRVVTPALSAFVRQDWLDKLKLPAPKTTQEFYNVLKAFKEKDPGNTGGKVIPFALSADPQNTTWTAKNLLDSFIQKMNTEDKTVLPDWVKPGYKEGMRFLNKLYNEGLISPQFALDRDSKQYEKDVVQGLVGSFINNYDYPYRPVPGWSNELSKNVPGASLTPIDPFTNFEGKHPKYAYNPNGFYIIVPKFSKNAVAAVKYLNWMAQPEVLKFLQNGIKGDQYTNERNGIPVDFVPNDKLPDDKKYNFTDLSIITNGKEFGTDEKNAEAVSFGYTGYEELYKKAHAIGLTDGYTLFHYDVVIENEGKYATQLRAKEAELYVKSIIAKPTDFDKTYDALVKEYMSQGGQAIADEKRAAYRAMLKAAGK